VSVTHCKFVQKKENKEIVQVVNVSAFETISEADLVAALHELAHSTISLVPDDHGDIVSHISFSPVAFSGHPSP
jgi:predicted N-acetyltransferase YhbS